MQDGGGDAGAARIDALIARIVGEQVGGDHIAAEKLAGEREAARHADIRQRAGRDHRPRRGRRASKLRAPTAPAEYVAPAEPGTAEAFGEELHALGPEGSAIVGRMGRAASPIFRRTAAICSTPSSSRA